MDILLILGAILLAGIITGKNARSIRELLLLITSMSFVLLAISLLLFYHFLYINELLIMLCGFILILMILLLWEKENNISQKNTIQELTKLIYNMIIVFTLSLGGLIIAFRVMYFLENPYILPYLEYISYPLLFAILLFILLWFCRYLIHYLLRKNKLKYSSIWMIIILFFVFIFNTFNVFYTDNKFEKGNVQESLFHHIDFYETYEYSSTSISIDEDVDTLSIQDYFYTEDTLYLTIKYNQYFDQGSSYFYYQLSRDNLQIIDSKELPAFNQFLGETESSIIYYDAENNRISSLNGSIDFQISNPIYTYEISNNQITILTRYFDDDTHIDKYIYNIEQQELFIIENINYNSTRSLYNLNGEVVETIKEEYIIYEDQNILYFHYPLNYSDVYRYQNGEVTFFATINNYQEIILTKHGTLSISNREGSMYNNVGDIVGQVRLHGSQYTSGYQSSLLYDVLDDGTFRYIKIQHNKDDRQMDISNMDLHAPHIPIYLQYYMSPFVGLFLLTGLLPFKKQDF